MLEIRLNELYDVVDKFVIVEANETFLRERKEYLFATNKNRYKKFLDKIIYIPIEYPKELASGWAVENYQRNQIMRGLTNCSGSDIIIISDLDEIPRKELFSAEKIPSLIQQLNGNFLQINQSVRYYFLNFEDSYEWYGSTVVSYAGLKQYSPQTFRNLREHPQIGIKVKNGGWHLSYIADIENIQFKIRTFAHEFGKNDYTNIEKLTRCVNEGLLYFDETRKFKLIPIEECDLPDYVKQNLEKFRKYIKDKP